MALIQLGYLDLERFLTPFFNPNVEMILPQAYKLHTEDIKLRLLDYYICAIGEFAIIESLKLDTSG